MVNFFKEFKEIIIFIISNMEKYDEIIPLGYVCNVSSMLAKMKVRNKAYPFDRVGSPMWAVYELFENDFDGFLSEENMVCEPLFEDKRIKFVYDKRYYIRTESNVKDISQSYLKKLQNKMPIRIQRLTNALKENNTVLFIRSQEPKIHKYLGKRVIDEEYQKKYEKSEYDYLVLFSQLVKTRYPTLEFKILFLSDKGKFNDEENNIIGIPVGPSDYSDNSIGNKMKEHLKKYQHVLY